MKIDDLSASEKVILAQQLWDSVVAENQISSQLTPQQTRELDRRIEEYESGSATLLDWSSVKSKVLGS